LGRGVLSGGNSTRRLRGEGDGVMGRVATLMEPFDRSQSVSDLVEDAERAETGLSRLISVDIDVLFQLDAYGLIVD